MATVFALGACAVCAPSSAQTDSSAPGVSGLVQALVWTKEHLEEASRLYDQAEHTGLRLSPQDVPQDIAGLVEAVIAWHRLEEPLPSSDELPPWLLFKLCRLVLCLSPSDPEADGPAAVSHLARELSASQENSLAATLLDKALEEWHKARGL